MRSIFALLLSSTIFYSVNTLAWDSVGHRLTVAVAVSFLSEEKRQELVSILRSHPRYQDDFLSQIPDFINQNDATELSTWLLGQAAYWPDIARGLPAEARNRYNRPNWHYTDGAWVRGAAQLTGNIYLGVSAAELIQGEAASSIRNERQVHNVVTAIDFNTRVLVDDSQAPAARAVALCWVLHLMGDIHQPLHAGSLFSRALFETGDRGSNGIDTGSRSTLHLDWDRALRDEGISNSLPLILDSIAGYESSQLIGIESDWTAWMAESREILLSVVYTEAMRTAITRADQSGSELGAQSLSSDYINGMKNISRQRLGLAGMRLAIFFENELN
ncbi:MAG: hypothetical protein GKR91_13220 [Pseudomonadales bacterium]|nr:hypothetical protein [Pseudomonadales bacterium]